MASPPTVPRTSRRVTLARHPSGLPDPECFELLSAPPPIPSPGEVLVRVREFAVEPFVRTLIRPGGGLAPGDTPPATAIAEVVSADCPAYPVGTQVLAETGWREWAAVPAEQLRPLDLPNGVPPSAALSALGVSGLTAYAALVRQLRPAAGETLVISSATGAVGSVADALARAMGARTVALVGDEAKADAAREVLGYSAAVLRTGPRWRTELAAACPDGVHGYLHMGDAEVLAGVLKLASVGARISLCGLMDRYNDGADSYLPASEIIGRRLTVHGMVVHDHLDLATPQRAAVLPLLVSGDLQLWEERHQGLEALPEAFCRVLAGRNRGKAVLEL